MYKRQVLEYSLGNDIEVESLTFEKISDEFLEGEKNNGLSTVSYTHLMRKKRRTAGGKNLKKAAGVGNSMVIL